MHSQASADKARNDTGASVQELATAADTVHPPASQKKRTPPTMEIEWHEDRSVRLVIDGDFSRISKATGNPAVKNGLLGQISILGSPGTKTDANASNFALGFVDSMEPQDATEALLLTQMAAIHQATMHMARRLNHVENILQQDSAERALNKLARTYAAQVEALKRYRSKGQQVVRVERVTVESGAQAVVGNVNHGGRGHGES
ncbi:hypothetical protein [Paracoccus sp. J39]|uniref:hypothetical protein n=1 Tax=Paracoccus sp. J39 TaxID=935848 RepID=UPI0012EC4C57|nr:hypothetical protein [Paracoccus sp. J39]